MDWLNWISTTISSLAREGLRVTSIIVILAALLKVPWVQRLILRYMPRRFRQREHTRNTAILYEIRELRARMEEMAWDAGSKSGDVNGPQSTLLPLAGAPVVTTTSITRQTGTFQLRRSEIIMKAYLKKLGRTKFQALLVSLIVNLASAALFMTKTVDIDKVINQWMPIINMTVATVSTWVYIAVEGSVDKANATTTTTVITAPVEQRDVSGMGE